MYKIIQILSKSIGFVLIVFGTTMLIYLGFDVWELYNHPEQSIRFAEALRDIDSDNDMPFILLKVFAWLIIFSLLLIIGKVAVWAIDSGHLLLTNSRESK